MSIDLTKTLKLDFFSDTVWMNFFNFCIVAIILFLRGTLRPQKPYGLLGMGKSWFSSTDLFFKIVTLTLFQSHKGIQNLKLLYAFKW